MNANDFIETNPEKMSGVPVFMGTRVPITHLFEYLEAGDNLGTFLSDFPTVTRDQAQGVLEIKRASSPVILLSDTNDSLL